jgi:transporter family protein
VKAESTWLLFALGSAFFGGATAILAKIGVAGIDSNLATFYRTCIVLVFAALLVTARGGWAGMEAVASRTWVFLGLSGLATAASWLCYFRALVIAMALGVLALGEPVNARFLIGASMMVAGIFVIAGA